MIRSILAATLSLALALPAAPPARAADAEDLAKIVGGLAALYVLKEVIENQRRTDNRIGTVRRAPVYQPPIRRPHVYNAPVHSDRPVRRQHDRFGRHDVRLLPDRCYREVETRRGVVAGYGARCLQNRVARPGLLPPDCVRQVRTDRGLRNLYGPRCLRQQGWSPRTARR
ncbi:MAG: hypothetical protein AAF264_13550 [Pseudomonadota bacterium]